MLGSLEGVVSCLLWKICQQGRFQQITHHYHLVSRCWSHCELKINMRSRELLRENISLHKLVDEGCLNVADVKSMLFLTMQTMMLYNQTQVVKKCVLQLVVVVQKLQLLIQVVSYFKSYFQPSTCSTFRSVPWFLSNHNLGMFIMLDHIHQHY